MKPTIIISAAAVVLAVSLVSCRKQESTKTSPAMTLEQKIARFAPTEISADVAGLSPGDTKALHKIIEAAQLLDPMFLRQVWSGNVERLKKLETDSTTEGKELLHYFRINMGPWSLLDNNASFINGAPKEKPAGANYYPEDMSKEEFSTWIKGLNEQERENATGFFYTVRRAAGGHLQVIPYSSEYREWLKPAAALLQEAARSTDNTTLKKFLTARADAFGSNDYYASDVAWMELDAPIELTIGPYETYMDELFNYKAAFEVFVTLRDETESAKLEKFSGYLQEIENNLPFDAKYRNPKLAALSPIRVVDVIYAAGEGNRGVQTAAFNLPNDERVIREKGSKRVMLKNMQEAKFNKILLPISKLVLAQDQQADVSFNAFFTHILAHELMHGLGPHNISVNGKETNVRQELKELYSAIEEAKADITGLFALQFLIDRGLLEKRMEQEMYTTFLASMFRSVRFGVNEAHGKGVAIQFNVLTDAGAIRMNEPAGTFSIDMLKIKDAVKKLTGDILTIEAEGSYEKAQALIQKYAVVRPAMQRGLEKLGSLPIDIEPQYTLVPKTAGSIR
ncbi:MAG: hypothetical protein EHM64_00885 [Ignavibacteriae bacterium]|nr:MAG: hypothetical protein EHM64_00885 [Ignavibacteriota bacterium]